MHPPGVLRFAFLLSLTLVLYPRPSGAILAVPQESNPSRPADQPKEESVRLDSLVEELLKSNPELQAARKRYEAALTRPAQESALPDPRITAGWISNGWPYPGAGLGAEATSNIGIQVAQEIPFPGKRALKGGIAQKEADSEAQAVRATELRLVAQLKERYYELLYIYEAVDLIHRNQELLQQMAKVAEARYSAGKAMQQDIIKAGIEVAILENRLIALEQKKLSINAEINALINRPPDAGLGRPETVSTLPSLEPFESLRARALEASPLLQGQRAVIDGRQLNVQSAQKAYYPDFDVMTGYYNQGAMKPMWEFKVQLNIPLYFGKKQRYGLEEAGANLAEAQRTYRNEQQVAALPFARPLCGCGSRSEAHGSLFPAGGAAIGTCAPIFAGQLRGRQRRLPDGALQFHHHPGISNELLRTAGGIPEGPVRTGRIDGHSRRPGPESGISPK